jgi:hypothetical protein
LLVVDCRWRTVFRHEPIGNPHTQSSLSMTNDNWLHEETGPYRTPRTFAHTASRRCAVDQDCACQAHYTFSAVVQATSNSPNSLCGATDVLAPGPAGAFFFSKNAR